MPRRSMKQRKQRGGGYNLPSEYFGSPSGQYLDASDPALAPRASNPTIARAEHAVTGNASTELTGIQTGGARKRRSRRKRSSRKVTSRRRRPTRQPHRRARGGGSITEIQRFDDAVYYRATINKDLTPKEYEQVHSNSGGRLPPFDISKGYNSALHYIVTKDGKCVASALVHTGCQNENKEGKYYDNLDSLSVTEDGKYKHLLLTTVLNEAIKNKRLLRVYVRTEEEGKYYVEWKAPLNPDPKMLQTFNYTFIYGEISVLENDDFDFASLYRCGVPSIIDNIVDRSPDAIRSSITTESITTDIRKETSIAAVKDSLTNYVNENVTDQNFKDQIIAMIKSVVFKSDQEVVSYLAGWSSIFEKMTAQEQTLIFTLIYPDE